MFCSCMAPESSVSLICECMGFSLKLDSPGQYALFYLGLHVLFILPFTGQYSSNINDILLAHTGGVA